MPCALGTSTIRCNTTRRDGFVGIQPSLCYGEYAKVTVPNEVAYDGRFPKLLRMIYKHGGQQAVGHMSYRWRCMFTAKLKLNEILCFELASCDEQDHETRPLNMFEMSTGTCKTFNMYCEFLKQHPGSTLSILKK